MERVPRHDPFDAPDVEDEADTRERVLEGGEDAGDGDAPRVRRELGVEDDTAVDASWSAVPSTRVPDEDTRERIAFEARDRGEAPQPGFDLHGWESAWASIDQDAEGDPDAALSMYAELVERMLAATGYAIADPVVRQGDEPEVVVTYLSARETAERAELGEASRTEVELAIEDLRTVFDSVAGEVRPA